MRPVNTPVLVPVALVPPPPSLLSRNKWGGCCLIQFSTMQLMHLAPTCAPFASWDFEKATLLRWQVLHSRVEIVPFFRAAATLACVQKGWRAGQVRCELVNEWMDGGDGAAVASFTLTRTHTRAHSELHSDTHAHTHTHTHSHSPTRSYVKADKN